MQELQKKLFKMDVDKNSAQRIFQSFKLCIASNKESQIF